MKGQRDRRDHGTVELQSFGRVLDVVEVLRLLALQMRPWQSHREQGRQITDGGKQRVAPGHVKLITPPPCADGAREGEGVAWGRGSRFAHPRLYSVGLSGLKASFRLWEWPSPPRAVQDLRSLTRVNAR